MKLVILDSYKAVANGLSLDCLRELCGEVEEYDHTPPELLAERIGKAEMVLVNKTALNREILCQCPSLKYIGLFATGYNAIDIRYCRENGIVVSNAPSYSTDSVAQLVFAYLLHFADLVSKHDAEVHAGTWQNSRDAALFDPRIFELSGKTLGIIGFGSIGRRVAELARAFRMEVLISTRTPPSGLTGGHATSLEELLEKSDFISIHCPLFPETERLIDARAVAKMKPGAILINTARGGILDEQAVADGLNSGKLRGAAVDVAASEPIRGDNPLLTAKNCVITPHIAWATRESRERLIRLVYGNIKAFLEGLPINNVAKGDP